jgi:MFS family permease
MPHADDHDLARESLLTSGGVVTPAWRNVMTAVFGLAFGPTVFMMSFGVFAPELSREFGWSIASISRGSGIMALMLVVVSPIQGFLVDRYGARRVILLSQPLFAFALLGLSCLGTDIRMLYLLCVTLPVLAIGLWPGSFNRLVSSWFDERLGLALGITNTGIGIGATLLPVVIGVVFATVGWRAGYAGFAAVVLFAVWPISAIFLRDRERPIASVPGQIAMPMGLDVSEVLRTGPFWLLVCGFLGLGAISAAIVVHQVGMLIDRDVPNSTAILFQSALGVSSIAGRVVAGLLLDRMHLSKLMSIILVSTFCACATYAMAAPAPMLFLASLCLGFLIGAELDVLGYALRSYFGLRSFGQIWGFIYATFQIGGAIGVFGLGFVREGADSYVPAMWALAVISVMAIVFFSQLPAYRYDFSKKHASTEDDEIKVAV